MEQNDRQRSASYLAEQFGLDGQVAVVTGGTGVLGGAIVRALAQAGARVAILGRRRELGETVANAIRSAGGEALVTPADVLQRATLEAALASVLHQWGRVDILVNAAGGNVPAATLGEGHTLFDLPEAGFRAVLDLNLLGSLLPVQVFGAAMAARPEPERHGSIVMISSMAAQRAMTRVGGYGAAKAGIESLTRWLAVELARAHGPNLRVNAVAPGFFIGEQNRRLLVNEDDTLTARGQTVIAHTPAGRFGEPGDLVSTVLWLCGPGARFVTGVVVPVDGGFSAFSGV